MPSVDVLLPTCNRPESLILTLSGLASQTLPDLHLILADQSDRPAADSPVVTTLLRILAARGGSYEIHHRPFRRGIAEQRAFLLDRAQSPHVLYLDDDVFMEPWVLAKLLETLRTAGGAFVGAFGAGLSFLHDIRPDQQTIEYWDGPVEPEIVAPDLPAWERWQLHRAANLYHLAQNLPPGEVRRYKVAWVGACTLYDRAKLLAVGGFSFWRRLPRYHSGEEVLVQNLLLRRWGGCAIIPSGVYFAEVPTTVLNAEQRVDGHALDLLPEMLARYAPTSLP